MTNLDPRLQKIGLGLLAPVLALVLAFLITSLVLVLAGDPVGEVWSTLLGVPAEILCWTSVPAVSTLYFQRKWMSPIPEFVTASR